MLQCVAQVQGRWIREGTSMYFKGFDGTLFCGRGYSKACLPSEAAREVERQRLVQKLRTGIVQDVWLMLG